MKGSSSKRGLADSNALRYPLLVKNISFLSVIGIASFISLGLSWGAQAPDAFGAEFKKKLKSEIYSAYEEGTQGWTVAVAPNDAVWQFGPVPQLRDEPISPPAKPKSQKSNSIQSQRRKVKPVPKSVPPSERAPENVPENIVQTPSPGAEGFDEVPADHIGSISRRLQLVREILIRHHRAYDYRKLTISDLEKVLENLDREAGNPVTPEAPAVLEGAPIAKQP
jgi:hypothetical protein